MTGGSELWLVFVAVLAGALRVSTPFLFVSLGECLTEKAGRINLGNEGVLVLGAMMAYAVSYETGSPWAGVVAAALAGAALGAFHALVCSLARVNDIAMGIAIMLTGTGLAFYFGKPYVQPSAPLLPVIPLGFWSDAPQVRSALSVSPLFFGGVAVAFLMAWSLRVTRAGLTVRVVGDSEDAARAIGLGVLRVRLVATVLGSALAGIGGASLSLSYPGSWNEGLSSGQGLIAIALVVFARWTPIGCAGAALLFGAAGALGPALQTIGVSKGYYLFNAAPYLLTLFIMVLTVAPGRTLKGVPGELSLTR